MGTYDRFVATAKRMIAEKGDNCTWHSRVASAGGTAAKPTGTTTVNREGVKIAFFPIDREYLDTYMSMHELTEVPRGLVQGYMAQQTFVPTLKDGVTRSNGEVLNVVDDNGIEEINPDGTGVILYIVRFSR